MALSLEISLLFPLYEPEKVAHGTGAIRFVLRAVRFPQVGLFDSELPLVARDVQDQAGCARNLKGGLVRTVGLTN